jgi:hypothetical protein
VTYDRRASNPIKIEVEVSGPDGQDAIVRLLKCIRFMGSIGTSRGIMVEDTKETITSWDGDGADKILSIRVNGQESELTEEERKEFNRMFND